MIVQDVNTQQGIKLAQGPKVYLAANHYVSAALLVLILYVILSSLVNNVFAQTSIPADNEHRVEVNLTVLHEKFYRRALYFYFQNDYSTALGQIEDNKIRLTALTAKSQLFVAGLQLSVGLQQQAKKTLLSFEQQLSRQNLGDLVAKNRRFSTQQKLLLIALLQLAEQDVLQGRLVQAQQTLQKITQVPHNYYAQYHNLSQLAYWPNKPVLVATHLLAEDNVSQNSTVSPFVQMNQALRHMEKGQFYLAKPLLVTLKNQQWQGAEVTFWQALFNNEVNEEHLNTAEQLQHQAINDYARLLLAQLYVNHEQYQQAFNELEIFPELSPYTESALFLFAFSAQQVKQYSIALNLLTLLAKDYPYSSLSWQAGDMLAAQVSQQNSLEQGLVLYQKNDVFYQQKLKELTQFDEDFNEVSELLYFSVNSKVGESVFEGNSLSQLRLSTTKQYLPESQWLQKALKDIELNTSYHELIELDLLTQHLRQLKQKSYWLGNTLLLNQARKNHIAKKQQEIDYQTMIQAFSQKRDTLSQQLAQAKNTKDGKIFANNEQQQWLSRIEKSHQSLNYLKNIKDMTDYQERLQRVEGVLAWQLKQVFVERLWQHQKQVNTIDRALLLVNQQLASFENLAKYDSRLSIITQRHMMADNKIEQLLTSVQRLRSKVATSIRTKVINFIKAQKTLLSEHLLGTRRAMASVLEQLAVKDRKIEQQLTPDNNVLGAVL